MARRKKRGFGGTRYGKGPAPGIRGKCEIDEYPDMGDVKKCARECGSHWFDKDTMRFFKSRVGSEAYADGKGGAYFVSSEQGPDEIRRYSIQHFNAKKCNISTIGKFQKYKTGAIAKRIAKKISAKASKRRK